MKEHLLTLADNLDALGHEKHADLIAELLFKSADTLSDLEAEWLSKGYQPFNEPYRKPGDNVNTYRKFRNPASGDVQEVLLPLASTQDSGGYRASPEKSKPVAAPLMPEGLSPDVETQQEQAPAPGVFQRIVDALGTREMNGILISTADQLDLIGREALADKVEQILYKIAEKEVRIQDERPEGPGWVRRDIPHMGTQWVRDRSALGWTDWALTGGPHRADRPSKGGMGPDMYERGWVEHKEEPSEKATKLPSELGMVPKA
jgi:hypothetical protein